MIYNIFLTFVVNFTTLLTYHLKKLKYLDSIILNLRITILLF